MAARTSASTLVPVGSDDLGTKTEVDLMGLLEKAGFLPRPVDVTQLLDARYSEQITQATQ